MTAEARWNTNTSTPTHMTTNTNLGNYRRRRGVTEFVSEVLLTGEALTVAGGPAERQLPPINSAAEF
jgi:hypothetical protein